MKTSTLLYKNENNIGIITLNNPQKSNAIDEQFLVDFLQLLVDIDNDRQIRAVILQANGKHFCAGANLHWMKRASHFADKENLADAQQLSQLLKQLNTLSKPTIALAHGHTAGGGIGLLCCCDIVLATLDATFCFSEVKLGLIAASIAPYIVPCLGYSRTKFYFLSAKTITASTALDIGLVHEIHTTETLHKAGMVLAGELKRNGPKAMAATKQLLQQFNQSNTAHIAEMAKWLATIRGSSEAQEGMQAFFDKRLPVWAKE